MIFDSKIYKSVNQKWLVKKPFENALETIYQWFLGAMPTNDLTNHTTLS